MSIIKTNFSKKAVEKISESIIEKSPAFYSNKFIERDKIELSIICEVPFNLREFVSYLRMTDRIYGRLLDWNLNSYSHKPSIQLEISEVRFGSFEIVTAQELSSYVTPLAILWLILKYLPDALKTSSEAYKNWKDSLFKMPREIEKLDREVIKIDEETKLLVINRKKLELELRNEELLFGVEEKHLKQIPQMIKEILSKENEDIKKARNFALKNVKDVKIEKKLKN